MRNRDQFRSIVRSGVVAAVLAVVVAGLPPALTSVDTPVVGAGPQTAMSPWEEPDEDTKWD